MSSNTWPLNLKPESLLSSLRRNGIYGTLDKNAHVQFLIQTDQNDPQDCRGYDTHDTHGAIDTHRCHISRCYIVIRTVPSDDNGVNNLTITIGVHITRINRTGV